MSTGAPKPLLCPFCGARLARPRLLELESYADSEGNQCVCGAFYAVDYTSHNLGQAMLDAYCFAAGSAEAALDLDPEADLDEAIVEAYDPRSHTVMAKKSPGFKGASLYFVRLRPGAAERLAREGGE